MSSKRHKPEEIVAKLRQVDVLTSQGSSVADAIRQIGVTEVIIIESWRRHDDAVRPHASLGYRPPAPEVFGGVPSRVCGVAGGASWISFAGHAPASTTLAD